MTDRRHRAGAIRTHQCVCLALAGALLCGALQAAEPLPQLVVDLDTTPEAVGSEPRHFRRLGDKVYFTAQLPASGAELYVSDGSTAQLVQDLAPGPASSQAVALGHAGGRLIVAADDGTQEYIAALDPPTGGATRLVGLGQPRPDGYSRSGVIGPVGQRLLFSLGDARTVWGSDGSVAGTQPLFAQQGDTGLAERICLLPARAVLLVAGGGGYAFWRSDATPAGTVSFAGVPGGGKVSGIAAADGFCYFLIGQGGGWNLWRSDGFSAGVIAAGPSAQPLALAVMGTAAYVADQSGTRFRLWRSDRLQPVVDLAQGAPGLDRLFVFGDRLIFGAAQDGTTQAAFYLSDGTAAGTQRLTPTAAMPQATFPPRLRAAGNALIAGDAGGTWRLDAATGQVGALGQGLEMLTADDAAELDGVLIGAGAELPHTTLREVWRSDGTSAGTRLLHDLARATRSALSEFSEGGLAIGDTLLFREVIDRPLVYPLGRRALWRTDGSAAGTRAVPRSHYGETSVTGLAVAGDALIVRTDRADGLAGGADFHRLSADLASGAPLSFGAVVNSLHTLDGGRGALLSCSTTPSARDLCALRGGESQAALIAPNLELQGGTLQRIGSTGGTLLFYLAQTGDGLRGLWRSDGTTPGTYRLVPELVRSSSLGPVSVALGPRLLFDGRSQPQGTFGLHASDASMAGTLLLSPLPARARGLQRWHDGRAVFFVDTPQPQLWFSDGSSAGTQPAFTLAQTSLGLVRRVGRHLHYFAMPASGLLRYYVSDGSLAGTREVTLPAGFAPESDLLAALDESTALLRCRSAATGIELCAADADGGQARLLRDILPGAASSDPRLIGSTPAASYFAANDGTHGRELWRVAAQPDRIFVAAHEVVPAP